MLIFNTHLRACLILVLLVGITVSCQQRPTLTMDQVDQMIDAWHDAASRADFDAYFSMMSENSIFIGTLEAGNSEDIILSINPDEMGKKILSLNLSYMNGDNKHHEKYDIPIEIIDVLDVAPILTDIPSTIKKGKSSRIGLEVYNAKTESITGVIITPISVATVIPSQYFIGAMDPDDVFSASFDIFTDNLDYGNNTIRFKVSFKQGSEYYETPSISHIFRVVSGDGTSYQSSTDDNSESNRAFSGDIFGICVIIIPIIVIIIIIFIIWKWRKGRKNE